MGAVLGSSLFIICGVIIYYTLFYLKTYEETTQELFSSINNKAHSVSLSLFFVSLLVILYYLTLLDSDSQVFGVPLIPGGLIIYLSLFIGLFGFYCLSICMKVAATEYPNDPNYEYAMSVYNTLLSVFSSAWLHVRITSLCACANTLYGIPELGSWLHARHSQINSKLSVVLTTGLALLPICKP